MRNVITLAALWGLAGVAACLLAWLQGPLPWLLGPLLAVMALRCGWPQVAWPALRGVRRWGLCLVGLGIGLHFNQDVWREFRLHGCVMLMAASLTVMTAFLGYGLLRGQGERLATAWFAALPGGASDMASLAEARGARADRVAAAHSVRMLVIVLSVPPAFHAWAGVERGDLSMTAATLPWLIWLPLLGGARLLAALWQRLGWPSPWVLAPLLLAAAVAGSQPQPVSLPAWLGLLGQLILGVTLGSLFSRDFFRYAPQWLARVLLFTLLAGLFTALAGLGLARLTDLPPAPLMLAMMPGGIAELGLTAEALGMPVALVVGIQVLRLVLVLCLAVPLCRWLERRSAADPRRQPDQG